MEMRHLVILCAFSCCKLQAQQQHRTKEDSIKPQHALDGEDSLLLRPEVLESIKLGRLINTTPPPKTELKENTSPTLPIIIDFSEYIKPEDGANHWFIPFKDLPAQVAKQYQLPEQENPREMKVNPYMLDLNVENDIQNAGATHGGGIAEAINRLASKKLRQQHRNKKIREKSIANYNALRPDDETLRKRKEYAHSLSEQDSISKQDSLKKQYNDKRYQRRVKNIARL